MLALVTWLMLCWSPQEACIAVQAIVPFAGPGQAAAVCADVANRLNADGFLVRVTRCTIEMGA